MKVISMTEITNEQFDRKLAEILDRDRASSLLSIPGVYEVLSEEYNNQVLEELEDEPDAGEPVQKSKDETLNTDKVYLVALSPYPESLISNKVARNEQQIKEIITRYYEEVFFETVTDFRFDWQNGIVFIKAKLEWENEAESSRLFIITFEAWNGKLWRH